MSDNFVHTHTHTGFSLLDGANKIEDLIPYIKQLGMKSIAITDHGVLGGVISFYKECKKHNIKSLLGVEAYITEDEDGKEIDKTRDNMHMVLIAKDNIGYSGLLKLSTEAAFNNFYYKPRINKQKLKALAGHVIATSACLGGVIAKKINFNKDEFGRAIEVIDTDNIGQQEIEFYRNIFGNDFYLELQDWDNGDHFQPVYNKWLIKTGKELGVQFSISADAHYLRKEDYQLHEMLMAMQLGMNLKDYKASPDMQYGPHFYIKSSEEMLTSVKNWNIEEAFYNTIDISNKCNVEIELGKYKEPIFNIEEAEDYPDFIKWKNSKQNNLECNRI